MWAGGVGGWRHTEEPSRTSGRLPGKFTPVTKKRGVHTSTSGMQRGTSAPPSLQDVTQRPTSPNTRLKSRGACAGSSTCSVAMLSVALKMAPSARQSCLVVVGGSSVPRMWVLCAERASPGYCVGRGRVTMDMGATLQGHAAFPHQILPMQPFADTGAVAMPVVAVL